MAQHSVIVSIDFQRQSGALPNTWGSVATANLMRLADPSTAVFVAGGALMPGVLATL